MTIHEIINLNGFVESIKGNDNRYERINLLRGVQWNSQKR